ncbi:MAG: hypothetical protein C4589_09470 [Peptococcaceae bacterium]|nr:MAG: hypothetical protein C4589_09470 [Peptococcaceae bacterium]
MTIAKLAADLTEARAQAEKELANLHFKPEFTAVSDMVSEWEACQAKKSALQSRLATYEALEPLIQSEIARLEAEAAEAARVKELKQVEEQRQEVLSQLPNAKDQIEKARVLSKLASLNRKRGELNHG